jgi:hypothetical protein
MAQKPKPWVIRFVNGKYYSRKNLGSNTSSIQLAEKYYTKEDAQAMINYHSWLQAKPEQIHTQSDCQED